MNKDRFNVINNVKGFINYMDTLLVNYPRTSFNFANFRWKNIEKFNFQTINKICRKR